MPNIETKFFTFDQNNSGGSFVFDEDKGITHYVIIEGVDKAHAVGRAMEIGIYFNGCASGIDCDCCGDRWYEPWADEGTDYPQVYEQNIREDGEYKGAYSVWMKEGREVAIHPINGPIEWYGASK